MNPFRNIFPAAALILLLFLSGCCDAPSPAPPVSPALDGPAPWPHESANLAPDPAVRYGRLPNGLSYTIMTNTTPRDRVSLHLVIRAGSLNEADGEEGMAHFLEHMAFNGSRHFPPGELVKYFQKIGMEFGGDVNAHTGFSETVYDVMLPRGNEEYLKEGLLVMRDYADGLLLPPDEIERERNVILSEMRARDSAEYRTFVKTLKFEMGQSRVSRRLPIGETASLEAVGYPEMKAFYDAWYRPDRMVLVLVGDMDPDMAQRLIGENFGDMTAHGPARPMADLGSIDHDGLRVFHHYEAESGNTEIVIQTLVREPHLPDSLDFQTEEWIRDAADRILQHRLERIVSAPDAPLTEASGGTGRFLREITYSVMTGKCDPANWKPALGVLEQTLRQALEYGFTGEELSRVKKEILSEMDEAVKKAATRDSEALAGSIIGHLSADRVFQSPVQERECFTGIVESLTPAQVTAAFRRTWDRDHRLVMITGNTNPANGATSAEEVIRAAVDESMATPVSPPETQASIPFPYLPEPEAAGAVTRRFVQEDLGVVQVDFANGLRLNVKRTPYKAHQVSLRLGFGTGRSGEPAGQPGLGILARTVVNESGLGRMNRDQMEQALAGHQVDVVFDVDQGAFVFHGQSSDTDLPLAFQVLRHWLMDPGFRPESHELALQRYGQMVAEMSRNIEGVMMMSGERFLAGGDERFGFPPHDRVSRLTLADVEKWLRPHLSADPLELTVVGDVEPDTVIDLTARALGTLPAQRTGLEKVRAGVRFPDGERLSLSVPTRIDKGMVRVSWPTGDMWDIGRTRRLSLLADILSERLYEEIREKMGATYSPSVYHRASRVYPGYGLLNAIVTVNPPEAEAVVSRIRAIAADIATGGVTEEELERAKAPALTRIRQMREDNRYWMDSVLDGSQRHPEQLDWARAIVADHESVTTRELSDLARRFLADKRAAIILVRPGEQP